MRVLDHRILAERQSGVAKEDAQPLRCPLTILVAGLDCSGLQLTLFACADLFVLSAKRFVPVRVHGSVGLSLPVGLLSTTGPCKQSTVVAQSVRTSSEISLTSFFSSSSWASDAKIQRMFQYLKFALWRTYEHKCLPRLDLLLPMLAVQPA